MTHFGTYFLTYFLTYKSLVIWLFHFWKVFKPSLLFHKFIKNIQYTIRRMYCTAGFPSHPNNLFWRFWMRAMFARTHQHHSFFTVTCDTSFLGKTTLLYTFMTSKLILEHSWLLKARFFDRACAQYVTQGLSRGGGGSWSQFLRLRLWIFYKAHHLCSTNLFCVF